MALRNPVLYGKAFDRTSNYDDNNAMTIAGAAGKALILTALLIVSAMYTWYLFASGQDVLRYFNVGLGGSFIIGVITIFLPKISPFTSPLYVIINGLLIGALSAMGDYLYPGIVMNAVLITLGLFFITLFLYATRIVKVTPGLSLAISVATMAIGLTYLCDFILRLFGMNVPFLHENGWMGIGVSLVIIVVATSNLLIDFSNIEQYAEEGQPKYMEWYAAFGLMITVIWMYIEILRLLSKLAASRK